MPPRSTVMGLPGWDRTGLFMGGLLVYLFAQSLHRSAGMLFAPNNPRKPPNAKSGYPASTTVGTSCTAGLRVALVTASNLTFPAWAAPSTEANGITATWMRPSDRSEIALTGLL